MKYADTLEFTVQIERAPSRPNSRKSFRAAIKSKFRSVFAAHFDPTRLTRVEKREIGVTERDIDWHNASHGPLIK